MIPNTILMMRMFNQKSKLHYKLDTVEESAVVRVTFLCNALNYNNLQINKIEPTNVFLPITQREPDASQQQKNLRRIMNFFWYQN